MLQVIECAGFARKGTWPLGPALLDNTAIFVEAAREIWSLEDYWRATLKLQDVEG